MSLTSKKVQNTFNPLALDPEHVELLTERILMGLGYPPPTPPPAPTPPSLWLRLRRWAAPKQRVEPAQVK